MTLTIPPELEQQLTALAKETGRNARVLAAEALRQYLAREERTIARIRLGIAAAERGDGIPHAQVMAELDEILADAERRQ